MNPIRNLGTDYEVSELERSISSKSEKPDKSKFYLNKEFVDALTISPDFYQIPTLKHNFELFCSP